MDRKLDSLYFFAFYTWINMKARCLVFLGLLVFGLIPLRFELYNFFILNFFGLNMVLIFSVNKRLKRKDLNDFLSFYYFSKYSINSSRYYLILIMLLINFIIYSVAIHFSFRIIFFSSLLILFIVIAKLKLIFMRVDRP
jgi:hypothetical protein